MGKTTDIDDSLEGYSERKINWYPGHMNKAIRQILDGLKKVDIVLEIRDARTPLATANKTLEKKIGEKARLVVINKANLARPDVIEQWEKWFDAGPDPYLFINCFDEASLKKVVQKSKEVLAKKRGPNAGTKPKMKMMIMGLPNTGKSTIINKLANRNASKVAAKPGQTQHQLWVKINSELDLLDTPGVMPPNIEKYEHGIWLSAIHAIPDKIVPHEIPACYIVEYYLKQKSEAFKAQYKLESFEGSLVEILDKIAHNRGCIKKKNEVDYDRTYLMILNDFRRGDLGPASFGLPPRIRD